MQLRAVISITRAQLESRAKERPTGYFEHVSSRGRWEGETLWLTEDVWHELLTHYNSSALPPYPIGSDMPSLRSRLRAFCIAIAEWLQAGCKVVALPVYRARLSACRACPASRRWYGLPICALCGCTRVKLWLLASRCPRARWQPF